MIIPIWTDRKLNEKESALLSHLSYAHYTSAFRENASSLAARTSMIASGDYTKAIIAALSMLGGAHAPVQDVYSVLKADRQTIEAAIIAGAKLPGWGNSFFRGEPDPIWDETRKWFKENHPKLIAAADSVTKTLHAKGKKVYPNAACYTALAGVVLGVPKQILPYLVVAPRLAAWSELALIESKGVRKN